MTILAPIVALHDQNDIYGISNKVDWQPRPDYFRTMFDAKWKEARLETADGPPQCRSIGNLTQTTS